MQGTNDRTPQSITQLEIGCTYKISEGTLQRFEADKGPEDAGTLSEGKEVTLIGKQTSDPSTGIGFISLSSPVFYTFIYNGQLIRVLVSGRLRQYTAQDTTATFTKIDVGTAAASSAGISSAMMVQRGTWKL